MSKPPNTPNVEKWELFLKRNLTDKESKILLDLILETQLNKKIRQKDNKFQIAKLTFGDTLFDSFYYFLSNDAIRDKKEKDNFKRGIIYLIKIYQNYYDIFNNGLTLEESCDIQKLCNNILSNNHEKYEEIIMKFICTIYNVGLVFVCDGNSKDNFTYNPYDVSKIIRIKKIRVDNHNVYYFPVVLEKSPENLRYTIARTEFKKFRLSISKRKKIEK